MKHLHRGRCNPQRACYQGKSYLRSEQSPARDTASVGNTTVNKPPMVELADTVDLKSTPVKDAGSNPARRTKSSLKPRQSLKSRFVKRAETEVSSNFCIKCRKWIKCNETAIQKDLTSVVWICKDCDAKANQTAIQDPTNA